MKPILEIFSQGEEIVTGQVTDTNAAWLAQQAVQLGFTVTRHTAVGDKLDDLIALLREIAQRADCCICTGGLGPTCDDLTAEAVANAFDVPLVFDAVAFAQIEQFFNERNRVMPESNRKQALLPKGAQRLDNEWGTAPGFALQVGRCWFAFIAGVPTEMRHLFSEKIVPLLGERFVLQADIGVTIKTIGLGESLIQDMINTITLPAQVQLGFRASSNDVQTKLLFAPDYPLTAIKNVVTEITNLLGDSVFAVDGLGEPSGDLITVIDTLMTRHNYRLAVLESASHGLLASLCVGVDWLLSASYQPMFVSTDADGLITRAKALALALQKTSAADIVLVQLYQGDHINLHDKNKPIVLATFLLVDDELQQATHTLVGTLKRKQQQAAILSLDVLRRYLQQV